jgi:thiamine biosynthesis protein ThiS
VTPAAPIPGQLTVQAVINGEASSIAGVRTVAELLRHLALEGRLAVEINGRIVPRGEYGSHPVHEGDRIEIVRAIGGG